MRQPSFSYSVGMDVGGTFTDVVAYNAEGDHILTFKVPSSRTAPAQGTIEGLQRILPDRSGVSSVIHGTTVATNAVLERRGAKTALITTRGYRDVLEIGRQSRDILYDLKNHGRPEPLVPRNLRLEITERITHTGHVLEPLHIEEISQLVETIRKHEVASIAISLLHSYADPSHERTIKNELLDVLPYISISSDVNAEYREYERTSTTVLNAYLLPLVSQYMDQLLRQFSDFTPNGLVQVMRSNGGMMSVAAAMDTPLATIMSGPAGGVAACRYLADKIEIPNAISFDMGGTSTDVCLIADAKATVSNQRRLDGYPIRMPTVAVETIGAGGGSIAWLDQVGALKVGPQSSGAEPGPACYGLGGINPTVTDANLVLGYLNPDAVLGSRICIDQKLSEKAMGEFAQRFGYSNQQISEGIVEVANSNMIRALRMVSVQKGFDPRDFTLVAFGGAGPMHAGRLAQQLSMPRFIVPAYSSVFSAFGCLVSDLLYDSIQTFIVPLNSLLSGQLEERMSNMMTELVHVLKRDGYTTDRIVWRRSLDLRYAGQKYELEVPLPDGNGEIKLVDVRKDFDRIHKMNYQYVTEESVECVNLRVSAFVPTTRPELPLLRPSSGRNSLKGERLAYFHEAGEVKVGIYDRTLLVPTDRLHGPAIVEDEWSTTVVYPDQVLEVDHFGNMIVEVTG